MRATSPPDDSPSASTSPSAMRALSRVTQLAPGYGPALKEDGKMVILVKPQFEVGKGEVGKGGIVRDPAQHQAACDRVRACVKVSGSLRQITDSPILGRKETRSFCSMPNAPIKTVGLLAKPRSERATLGPELIAWLNQRGMAVTLDEEAGVYARAARESRETACGILRVVDRTWRRRDAPRARRVRRSIRSWEA